jgi:hypothetical protein
MFGVSVEATNGRAKKVNHEKEMEQMAIEVKQGKEVKLPPGWNLCNETKRPIRLEVGKHYRRRDKAVIQIVSTEYHNSVFINNQFLYVAADGTKYFRDGCFVSKSHLTNFDLVEEVTIYFSPMFETIVWKSVKDELPDAESRVLIRFNRNDGEGRVVTEAEYDDSLIEVEGDSPWVVSGDWMCFGEVTHWADMPGGPVE